MELPATVTGQTKAALPPLPGDPFFAQLKADLEEGVAALDCGDHLPLAVAVNAAHFAIEATRHQRRA